MVITIDGPAGAGKSTLSQQFAHAIQFQVLDTGAMYRCVAYLKKKSGLSLDEPKLQEMISSINIEFRNNSIWCNQEDVSQAIRTSEIDILTSQEVSPHPFVRSQMCALQRKIAENTSIVAEGRDMGSNVFPDAPLKFYLTADSKIRAERRYKQLQEKNISADLQQLEKEIQERDLQDTQRTLNPLSIPNGAIIIDTSSLSLEEILTQMLIHYQKIIEN